MSAEPNTQKPLEWPNYGPVSVSAQTVNEPRNESLRSHQESQRLWRALLLVVSATTLSACCATTPTNIPREECPKLEAPTAGDSTTMFLWSRHALAMYRECALK
jgi:hypothetical protein